MTVAPSDDSIPVDVDTMHHAFDELPNGNLMTLSTEMRRVSGFASSEFDPDAPLEPANVVTDRVVEFVPETGEVVDQLTLSDLLDPATYTTEVHDHPTEGPTIIHYFHVGEYTVWGATARILVQFLDLATDFQPTTDIDANG